MRILSMGKLRKLAVYSLALQILIFGVYHVLSRNNEQTQENNSYSNLSIGIKSDDAYAGFDLEFGVDSIEGGAAEEGEQ